MFVRVCECVWCAVQCVYESEWERMKQLGKPTGNTGNHRQASSQRRELVCACNIVSSLHLFYTHRQYKYRRWYHATTLGNRWLWYIICYRVDRTHFIYWIQFFKTAYYIDVIVWCTHMMWTDHEIYISILCYRRVYLLMNGGINRFFFGILAQVAWTRPLSLCWAPLVNGKSLHVFQATFNSQCNKNRRTLI